MRSCKVVVVTYGGGHVNMLLPVIKFLRTLPNLDVVVLGLTTAGSVLKRNDIPYLGFKDLLHLVDESAIDYGKKLVGESSNNTLVSFEESIAYMGLNYWELVNQYGEKKASKVYQEKGRHAFYPINLLNLFLKEQNPNIVVATNSPRTEKAAINAASELGIPSICLVDLFVYQSARWIGKVGYATKVCVLSDFVKKQLIDAGRPNNQVVVTGNPIFDSINPIKEKMERYLLNRRWKKAKKVVLWASQAEPKVHPFDSTKCGDPMLPRNIESKLFAIFAKHPEWQLVIRSHPSEVVEYTDLPTNVELSVKSDNLHELLAAVDCVITMTSTVAIEAALMGKRVITVDRSIFTKDSPYSVMGISEGIQNLNDLESTLCSKKVTSESVIQSVIGSSKGATEKVVNTILEVGMITDCYHV